MILPIVPTNCTASTEYVENRLTIKSTTSLRSCLAASADTSIATVHGKFWEAITNGRTNSAEKERRKKIGTQSEAQTGMAQKGRGNQKLSRMGDQTKQNILTLRPAIQTTQAQKCVPRKPTLTTERFAALTKKLVVQPSAERACVCVCVCVVLHSY